MQHQSKFERLAGQLDEVSTEGGSDRVLDAPQRLNDREEALGRYALGTDLIAPVFPSRVRMLPQFKQIYQE
ncbi:MAG: hypothetical protein QOG23_3246 [Blastocatellia bacterium]|jgi:hypothetical protein|nr:hypothetical protein [Blastocatellia bacterium]